MSERLKMPKDAAELSQLAREAGISTSTYLRCLSMNAAADAADIRPMFGKKYKPPVLTDEDRASHSAFARENKDYTT